VHYYLLEWQGGEELSPQREEGFVGAEWVPLDEAPRRVRYKETREILKRAQQALASRSVSGR
jgi:hypothetical protein